MFNIQMLPAHHGDCLWIEYGKQENRHRVLIDGGTPHTFEVLSDKIKNHPEDELYFELFVITHVDADHIGGSLELLRNINNLGKKIVFGDVWFNGWKHLSDQLGDMQGELLTNHLERRNLPWNEAFQKKAIVISEDNLPTHRLSGGLNLTLLSPTRHKLSKLRKRWMETITKEKKKLGKVEDAEEYFKAPADLLGDKEPDVDELVKAPFKSDYSAANGSSIAFLAEYENENSIKSCLFTGDAQVGVLISSIKRLITKYKNQGETSRLDKDGRLIIDAFKISHHGSKKNINQKLLDLVNCSKFLFSTGGQQFGHPDPEGIARVIKFGRNNRKQDPTLFFNYESEFNKVWNNSGLQFKHSYETEYPTKKEDGLIIKL